MVKSQSEVREVYRRRAGNYDISANLYYMIGFREAHYRKMAVDSLNLREGDTVVELACGTGLNFPLLEKAVGSEGRIIGVDMTDAMLEQAKIRVERNNWRNVDLVQEDIGAYGIPGEVDGIISTFAITLSPEYDRVIRMGFDSLREGGRFVVLDFKFPNNLLRFLSPLAIAITKHFAVEKELSKRHPWESIERYFKKNSFKEIYGGFSYLSLGER